MLEPVMGSPYMRLLCALVLCLSCTCSPEQAWEERVARQIRASLPGSAPEEGASAFALFDSKRLHAAGALRTFYESRSHSPAWVAAPGQQGRVTALLEVLESAEADGLDPNDLHAGALRGLLTPAKEETKQAGAARAALLDVLLTDALIVYANQIANGRIDPVSIDSECLRTPDPIDVQGLLKELAGGASVTSVFKAIAPADPAYTQLRQARLRYLRIAAEGGWPEIPADVAPGALSERLRIEGYPGKDGEVEAPLRAFQRAHGLKDSGMLDDATLRALNVPAAERAEQIALNLERWRWLPRELGMPRVVVNTAGFSLEARAPGQEPLAMHTIVGLAQRRTPVMSSAIDTLVLNPTWGVPPTIVKEDLLPRLTDDPTYLTRQEIRVFDVDIRAEVDPTSIDWEQVSADENSPYFFRQDAGPGNPLGRIKFLFPNSFDVYLHDTPAGALFDPRVRTFSSGCIRVEKAMQLGEYLLRASGAEDDVTLGEKLARARQEWREISITLPAPVPVHLVYWTAWIGREGDIQFRPDVYERDAALREALRQARPCAY